MSYTVTFSNLGRGKATFSVSSEKQPDYEFMRRHAGKHLASSEIDFLIYDEQPGAAAGRVVVDGFRPEGRHPNE